MDTNKLFNLGVNMMKAQAGDLIPADPNWAKCLTHPQVMINPRKQAHPECKQCQSDDSMTPNHDGSIFCESGSIAAKGTKSHCTCDFCY